MRTPCLHFTITTALCATALCATALCATACILADDKNTCRINLVDVTAESGITFQHNHGGSGESYIVEGVAS
ncbi:MAG: hypothetical protein HYV60_06025, partial [Planctomycetia bacterium]|nr:hypothetical protein [Planctomycetia bacterium]